MARLMTSTILALALAACTDAGTTDGPITGTWDGTFTTDQAALPMGTFAFVFDENVTTHAVTGTFAGGAPNTDVKLMGTFAGTRTAGELDGQVTVTSPLAFTLAFPHADISDGTISGSFQLTDPVTANGDFSLSKK